MESSPSLLVMWSSSHILFRYGAKRGAKYLIRSDGVCIYVCISCIRNFQNTFNFSFDKITPTPQESVRLFIRPVSLFPVFFRCALLYGEAEPVHSFIIQFLHFWVETRSEASGMIQQVRSAIIAFLLTFSLDHTAPVVKCIWIMAKLRLSRLPTVWGNLKWARAAERSRTTASNVTRRISQPLAGTISPCLSSSASQRFKCATCLPMVILSPSVLNLRPHPSPPTLPPGAHHYTKAVDPSFVPVFAVLHRHSSDLDSLIGLVEQLSLEESACALDAFWKSSSPQCNNSWQRCCDD